MWNKLEESYLFETSWEVCNKVGGIYTVVSTKVLNMQKLFGKNYFLIGPDVWKGRDNREFTEDKKLYAEWRIYAESKNVYFRIGRWNIEGSPIVVLVDFMSLIPQKDNILAEFWTKFNLDSISGQWDYIEPVLFGYAAAKVVETFYEHQVFPQEKVYAHFHEWMTGSGVLYLKQNLPQIGTVFTTHATVLGRCIAGNGLPLYSDLSTYNADVLSNKFGVRSKFSLEKLSAQETDVFTTVSEITDAECKQFFGKAVDILTPNGFDNSFVPNTIDSFETKRTLAKAKLRQVASALLNQKIPENALFVVNSGRYEFKNKGIDLYIDALAELNHREELNRPIIAFLTIPASHGGPRLEVLERMKQGIEDNALPITEDYCSHYLNEVDHDPILNRLRLDKLKNLPEDKVKVIFVPCYLDGQDGIFNLSYYDLLIGFDASIFPSYYEPWGYTPLESIAFSVPTLTTSLAGFGRWVQKNFVKDSMGVCVVNRKDRNDLEVVEAIENYLISLAISTDAEMENYRKQALDISRSALWDILIAQYQKAYEKVQIKWEKDPSLLNKGLPKSDRHFSMVPLLKPNWKKILIQPNTPSRLKKLEELSKNLWWSWNVEATALFENIDSKLWENVQHNPVALLSELSSVQMRQLESDTEFLAKMERVYDQFIHYMQMADQKGKGPKVAYFSMEFGLHESIKIYSGGLGILAGDYLKSASDKNADIIGVGLLYRYGYFSQRISFSGEQMAEYIPQAFSKLPLLPVRDKQGEWLKISISLPGRKLFAKIWVIHVGRIPLYLLDTDIDENTDADKFITHQLYGGDWENRFKQELLLGVGGIRMLRKIGIEADVFHCNEGHGAFIGLERLREYIEEKHLPFLQAKELVRGSSLFTTHTPVPAGHDAFSEDILRTYISHYPMRLKIPWEDFMALGRKDRDSVNDKFSMSFLAAHLSSEINGVSQIHGRVSREIFAPLYPGYFPEELSIGYVTNGVHFKTWTHGRWRMLYEKYFGEEFKQDILDSQWWQKIYEVPDVEIMDIRNDLRAKLIDFIKVRIQRESPQRGDNPQDVVKALEILNPKALTIGFARRFATYKRAHLLFKDLNRLSALVNNAEHPVQFVFAGKAHPADKAGQDLIRQIVDISRRAEFLGKIIFVENYDINVAKHLVQGVDVWMNTPTRPLEASGTSGEKAIMNGVLNLSVLDGWWAEGYKPGAGWALKEEQTYENPAYQDALDAELIYQIIEKTIVPTFYDVDQNGISKTWVHYIKNNIAQIAPHFTMRRQLEDYYKQYYYKLEKRFKNLCVDNYKQALNITKWKIRVLNSWDSIKMEEIHIQDSTKAPLLLGEPSSFEITLDLGNLDAEEIGVEVVFGQKENDVVKRLLFTHELLPVQQEKSLVKYACSFVVDTSGVYDYVFRIYPKNKELPYRQDFKLVKWF
ncbi:MAG: alpha-glucan family phosphorylase [Bacteroidales bacterium]